MSTFSEQGLNAQPTTAIRGPNPGSSALYFTVGPVTSKVGKSGLVHVRAAQADGRWERAYAPGSEMTVPKDFLAALAERPQAQAFFDTLNRANVYAIAYRLTTAKKPETRQRRFDTLLAMLDKGERIH